MKILTHLVMLRMVMTGIINPNQKLKVNVQILEAVEEDLQQKVDEVEDVDVGEKMMQDTDVEEVTEIQMFVKVHMEKMVDAGHNKMKIILEVLIQRKVVIAIIQRKNLIQHQMLIITLTMTTNHLNLIQAEDEVEATAEVENIEVAVVEVVVVDEVVEVVDEVEVEAALVQKLKKEEETTIKRKLLPEKRAYDILINKN